MITPITPTNMERYSRTEDHMVIGCQLEMLLILLRHRRVISNGTDSGLSVIRGLGSGKAAPGLEGLSIYCWTTEATTKMASIMAKPARQKQKRLRLTSM